MIAKTFVKYAVVGIFTNTVGYIVYLALTAFGLGPKTTMSCLYVVGALLGFVGNRQWAFRHEGGVAGGLLRYALAHASGYLLNLSLLAFFSDFLGYPHQLVQAVAIGVVAGFLFISFRYFVFPENSTQGGVA